MVEKAMAQTLNLPDNFQLGDKVIDTDYQNWDKLHYITIFGGRS